MGCFRRRGMSEQKRRVWKLREAAIHIVRAGPEAKKELAFRDPSSVTPCVIIFIIVRVFFCSPSSFVSPSCERFIFFVGGIAASR